MFRKVASLILVAFILSIGFITGHQVAGKKTTLVVRADAPVAHITQELNIGTVAGTESAIVRVDASPSPSVTQKNVTVNNKNAYDGEAILNAVNQYRRDHSLTAFEKDAHLCEFATERLNQLKSRGSIDNHEGFRQKLDSYFAKYNFHYLAENLAQGYKNPSEVISGWDNSAGHQALLRASDLTHACSAAQGGLVVLLAGRY